MGYWSDAYGQVRAGLVDGASFTFVPTVEEWDDRADRYEDGLPRVRVKEMIFIEGSPVTVPAYPDTSADRSVVTLSRSEGVGAYQAAIDRFRSQSSKSFRALRDKRLRALEDLKLPWGGVGSCPLSTLSKTLTWRLAGFGLARFRYFGTTRTDGTRPTAARRRRRSSTPFPPRWVA